MAQQSQKNTGQWKFLSDEAVEEPGDDCFGVHSVYASLLLGMCSTAVTPFSIGLYGSWGTGKTSVARILQSIASKANEIYVIYLDVWKYSSDPLKRWILLETERQLADKNVVQNYKFEGRTLRSHLEFEEHVDDETKISLDRRVIALLVSIVIVTLVAITLVSLFVPENWKSNGALAGLISVLSAVALTSALLTAVFGELLKSIAGMVFRRTVRQTVAKQAFSSEKFGEMFCDLVMEATKDNKRLLFIFDNLDRCSEETAVETISVIKTYLDEKNCVYLIPCDESALVRHIARGYLSQTEPNSDGYAREFLNKFFQVTIRLPSSADFDIEKYLNRQLQDAQMADLPTEALEVLVLGYMGQTPRQVKRVINDLVAFRSLAVNVEKSGLLPAGSLTGDLALLTKMSVISTQWPNFMTRLGEDPELWSEMAEGEFGPGTITEAGLGEFLRVTRHVSPSADARPFVFLKQFDFERDPVLSKSVEDCLRKGDWTAYEGLLNKEQLEARKALLVSKTVATVRQWLQAQRQIFVQNATPVIVKAALQLPSQHDLGHLALEVLATLAEKLQAADFEKVIDPRETLRIDPTAVTPQKRRIIGRLVQLFDFQNVGEITAQRIGSWRAIIEENKQLSAAQKQRVAQFFTRLPKDADEMLLGLLSITEQNPTAFKWLLTEELLGKLIGDINFSSREIDERRIRFISTAQKLLSRQNLREMANTWQARANFADGPSATQEARREYAENAIGSLVLFDAHLFTAEDVFDLVSTLVENWKNASWTTKGFWLQPLLYLFDVVSADQKSAIEESLTADIANAAHHEELTAMLTGLTDAERKQLLSLQGMKTALHSQPANLEKLGPIKRTSIREGVLKCFDAVDLAKTPEAFDESREWDLLVYVETVGKAASKEGEDPVESGRALQNICDSFIVGNLPGARSLYDVVCELVNRVPSVATQELANTLCEPTLLLVDSDPETYYSWFAFWKAQLPSNRRIESLRSAVDKFLQKKADNWISVLNLISDDLANDEELRQSDPLVKEVFDYAFDASEESPEEGQKPLLELLPYLGERHLRDYVDRALDTLITYEAGKEPLERMEPFLEMIESPAAKLSENDLDKLGTRFCRRMLGPSNTAEQRERVLKMAENLKKPELIVVLRAEIQQLGQSEEGAVPDRAKLLLKQIEQ